MTKTKIQMNKNIKEIILLILCFSTISLTSLWQKLFVMILTVYKKYTSLNVFTNPAVSKDSFEDFYNNKPKESKGIKIITDKKEICNIRDILNNLEFDSVLKAESNISQKQAFVSKKGIVFWLPIEDLDIRSQIILFSKGKFELVWISNPATDIGNARFLTSKELREYIQNMLNNKK